MKKNILLLAAFICLIFTSVFSTYKITRVIDNRSKTEIQSFSAKNSEIFLANFEFYDWDYSLSARGSWLSDTRLGNPIQTSRIECWKYDTNLNNVCIESTASLSSGMLFTDQEYWIVDKWDDTEISTQPHDSAIGCTRLSLRIDKKQKQVTKIRTTLKNTGECAGVDLDPIFLHLGDGSAVPQSK